MVDPDLNVMYFLANTYAIIQPMDQGIIEKIKRIYRKQKCMTFTVNWQITKKMSEVIITIFI